ncbi:MAG TPA: DUF3341 domain-containing protein [Bryobacteraceae bacterium]|nr:DUF3341 domain-containing protein [Bryobacteraceae bacterium]
MSIETLEAVHPLYGLMAEFETPGQLVAAARKAREAGFRRFDAYSPMPLHELDDAMDLHDNRVSLCTLIAGIVGACTGFGLASWVQAVALPLNIGGRPLISVPMYIPVTFELTILFGGLTAAISMIVLNGLPRPYHPVFNVDRFNNASRNKFFLCIETADPRFDYGETLKFLQSLNPEEIADVPR